MDKVSVIVPIYNVERYLKRCIESLIIQNYQNLEIILVDDASTDNSAAIAKAYELQYPEKIVFVQRKINGGSSASRNTGLSIAKGEWIAFVDSDDWVARDFISSMYEIAIKDNANIVMCGVYYYYSDRYFFEIDPFYGLTTCSTHKEKIALCRAYSTARLYNRTFWDKTGIQFPENIFRCEDIATIIPLLTYTSSISIIRKPYYYYYQREGSLSNSNTKGQTFDFYYAAIRRMNELAEKGFEMELEFRAISELMYGMVMIMIRAEADRKEIVNHIDRFSAIYPNWEKNKYMCKLPISKHIFIFFAKIKKIGILKFLIKLWDLKNSWRRKKFFNR